MSTRKALIVHGGWDGHTQKQSADLFATFLFNNDFEVELSDTLDVYVNREKLSECDLIVPIWTMGQISDAQGLGHSRRDFGWYGPGGLSRRDVR